MQRLVKPRKISSTTNYSTLLPVGFQSVVFSLRDALRKDTMRQKKCIGRNIIQKVFFCGISDYRKYFIFFLQRHLLLHTNSLTIEQRTREDCFMTNDFGKRIILQEAVYQESFKDYCLVKASF